MSEDNQFTAPPSPRSLRDVLEKAIQSQEYAKQIHETVREAREAMTEQAQTDAMNTINVHFALSPDELTFLKLPADYYSRVCRVCTNTRPDLYLLDFVTKTANYAAVVPSA